LSELYQASQEICFILLTILRPLKKVPWVTHLHISLKDDTHSFPAYFLMFVSSFVAILFTLMLVVRTTWTKQAIDSRRHKWMCNKYCHCHNPLGFCLCLQNSKTYLMIMINIHWNRAAKQLVGNTGNYAGGKII